MGVLCVVDVDMRPRYVLWVSYVCPVRPKFDLCVLEVSYVRPMRPSSDWCVLECVLYAS